MSARISNANRRKAVDAAMAVLEAPLFKALQEPSRLAVLRELMLLGRADIGRIAENLPQERSVISRHLQLLLDAGVVRVERAGRHRIYEVDGSVFIRKLEFILNQVTKLAPYCCPANNAEHE